MHPSSSTLVRYMEGLFIFGYVKQNCEWMLSTLSRNSVKYLPVALMVMSYLQKIVIGHFAWGFVSDRHPKLLK